MRTTSYVIGSTVALTLMVISASAFARAEQSDSDEASRRAFAECALTQCIVGGAPVLDAPFSAEATTIWRSPARSGRAELRATARYYRDGRGRVRVEQSFVGHDLRSQRIILTSDDTSRAAYLLDPVAGTISTPVPLGLAQMLVGGGGNNLFVLARSMNRSIMFFQVPAVNPDSAGASGEESLGQRSMSGIQVTGTRFATRQPAGVIGNAHAERWVSPELKLVVYSRHDDSIVGIVEHRLTNISRSDPGAELFEVPADYAVTPLEFPFTWEIPHTPNDLLTR